jgi:hypothetical protein
MMCPAPSKAKPKGDENWPLHEPHRSHYEDACQVAAGPGASGFFSQGWEQGAAVGGFGVFGGVGRGRTELGLVRARDADGAAGRVQEAEPGMVRRRCGVWLHDFFYSFLFVSVTRFGALVLFGCSGGEGVASKFASSSWSPKLTRRRRTGATAASAARAFESQPPASISGVAALRRAVDGNKSEEVAHRRAAMTTLASKAQQHLSIIRRIKSCTILVRVLIL